MAYIFIYIYIKEVILVETVTQYTLDEKKKVLVWGNSRSQEYRLFLNKALNFARIQDYKASVLQPIKSTR